MIRFFILSLLTASHLVIAQTEFGIVGGINAASQKVSYTRSMRISTNGPISLAVNPIMTYNAGVVLNAKLDKRIDLKAAVTYSGKGQYERVTRTLSQRSLPFRGLRVKSHARIL